MDLFHACELGLVFAGTLFMGYMVFGGRKVKGAATQAESALTGAWRTVTAPGQTDRTPGQVLDSLMADVHWIKTHTDAPADAIKALETVAGCLMHDKGAAPAAVQAQPVAGA